MGVERYCTQLKASPLSGTVFPVSHRTTRSTVPARYHIPSTDPLALMPFIMCDTHFKNVLHTPRAERWHVGEDEKSHPVYTVSR